MMRIERNTVLLFAAVALFFPAALAADYYPLRGLSNPADELEAFAEKCRGNPTPELLTTTGWLLHLYGADRRHNQNARQLFEKALESQPENVWARYGLCVIDEIKGDFDGVLSNSLLLCESAPSHPLALLAVLNLRDLFGKVGDFNRRVETVLRTLLAEKRSASIQFDEMCREILSAIARSRGDADELKGLVRERGYITDWRIIGPFGEFPHLSFLSKWKPESDRVLYSQYKVGERVLKPKRYSPEYGRLHPPWIKRGVYYAEAFLRSPSTQEVILRIPSYFPVELFLNNDCVYSKDTIRNYRPATEYVKVRLSPGYNRLLLKFPVGGWALSTYVFYKNIRFGCATSESAMYPAVQAFQYPYGDATFSVSASRHRWRAAEEVQHSEYQPSALTYFSGLLSENPNDPLALGICGVLKSVQGDVQRAKGFLLAALKHVPSHSYFNYVLGVMVGSDLSLPTQIRRSEARARFRSALTEAGVFPLALYQAAVLDIQDDKHLEAIDKLNQCIAQSPRFLSWHDRLYGLFEEKKWHDEQRQQLDRILGLGLESCRPYHLAEGYYRSTKQYDMLAEIIEKLQRTHVHPDFLARHSLQTGMDAKAIDEYLKLKTVQPRKESTRRSLVRLYERNKRWVEAEKELREALKLFPKSVWFWKELAQLKGYTGRWRAEEQTWKRVLRQDPVDRDARRALQPYGQKDMLDEFDIPSWPYIHDESIREKYAGVSSAIIIDQVVEEVYSNCSSRQKTHQLILLNDRKAIDQWGELDIPDSELLELRTIKKDGIVVEPERPGGGKATISMGGLQEGDFIEYKYITNTAVFGERPRRFLGQRFFFQSVEFPMELSQYVIIVPENMKLEREQLQFSERPSVLRKRGRKVYKWEARDVPAIPREPLAAPDTEFLPFVRVGVNYDQDAEILRYQDQNVAMIRMTDEIRETTANVLATCPDDVESRVRTIYSFVNEEVRGRGGSAYLSRSATETLADRRGDRVSLAKAMLDAAGIESRMLVVRGELAHASKVFPGSFTSALLAIRDTNGSYTRFLDFSGRYLPFGYISSVLQGGTAIPLQDFCSSDFGLGQKKKKLYGSLLTIPRLPVADNCEQRALTASVLRDGSIEGTQVHEYVGDGGAALRASMITAEAYQIQDFAERMASASFRAAALTSHKVHNLSEPEKPLLIEYGFRAPNFARVVGEKMLLDQWLPLLRLGARFASLEVRKSPLQISRDFNSQFRAVIKVPSGSEVEAVPSPLNLESDFGFYHLRVGKQGNSIQIENDFHLKAQRVSPEDYPRFVDFCRMIDAAERKEIRIRLQP